jgi:ABC-type multidrug transport system permease subunit
MNDPLEKSHSPVRYSPFVQLVLARLREFYREPEAIFWVYGFPILIVVALGIAFRNKPVERISVDVQDERGAQDIVSRLDSVTTEGGKKFVAHLHDAETCYTRLRTGRTDLVVVPKPASEESNGVKGLPTYEYIFDPARAESVLARYAVDDALRGLKRDEVATVKDEHMTEPGARYIDFLVPGLIGMSLMGGGLWGVGFVTVDMRIRKLLKRFLATPMRKSHFLAAVMASRLIFMIPEMIIIVIFAWLVFDVRIQGSIWAVCVLILVGAFTFSGLGLLIASRARTIEAVSGLMNLVMLPMWVLSGIFFSSERFPEEVQPIIKAIPLTPLINSLRAVYLEGATLASQWLAIVILAGWAVVSFVLALKLFRWQ